MANEFKQDLSPEVFVTKALEANGYTETEITKATLMSCDGETFTFEIDFEYNYEPDDAQVFVKQNNDGIWVGEF